MSESLFRRLDLKLENSYPSKDSIVSVEGRELQVLGNVSCSICISGVTVTMIFRVVCNVGVQILIGCDNLALYKAVIDIAGGLVDWRALGVVSELISRFSPDCIARATSRIHVPPGREMYIAAAVPEKFAKRDILIEPLPTRRSRFGMLVAKSLVRPENKQILCRIFNFSDEPLTIHRRQAIAVLSDFDIQEIKSVDQEQTGVYAVETFDPSSFPTDGGQKSIPKPSDFKSFDDKLSYLKEMGFKLNQNSMTDAQYERLLDLLIEYADCFMPQTECVDMPPYDIELLEDKPVPQPRIHRHSPPVQRIIDDQLQKWLDEGCLEEGPSTHSWPLVVVRKHCGCSTTVKSKGRSQGEVRMKSCSHPAEWRTCLDLRLLNKSVKNISFITPTLSDIIQDLKGNSCFSCLDVAGAFQQVPITEKTKSLLGVQTDKGAYRCSKLPFGLKTSSSIFQKLQTDIIKDYNRLFCKAYADDLLCYTKSIDAMLESLEKLLKRYRKYHLRLKPSKCIFVADTISYLGVTLSANGYSPDENKVKLIQQLPPPSNSSQLKSFLACIGFFRRFVRSYSNLIAIYRPLLAKNAKFVWTPEHQKTFDELKGLLMSPDVMLQYPDWNSEFHFIIDASTQACSYVIAQACPKTGALRPCLYGSRLWPKTMKHMSSAQSEVLALVVALESNRPYTNGLIHVHSDSISTVFLNSLKKQTGPLYRYAIRLQPFDLILHHKPGKDNAADYATRVRPSTGVFPPDQTGQEDVLDFGVNDRIVCSTLPLASKSQIAVLQQIPSHVASQQETKNHLMTSSSSPLEPHIIFNCYDLLHPTAITPFSVDGSHFFSVAQALAYFIALREDNYARVTEILNMNRQQVISEFKTVLIPENHFAVIAVLLSQLHNAKFSQNILAKYALLNTGNRPIILMDSGFFQISNNSVENSENLLAKFSIGRSLAQQRSLLQKESLSADRAQSHKHFQETTREDTISRCTVASEQLSTPSPSAFTLAVDASSTSAPVELLAVQTRSHSRSLPMPTRHKERDIFNQPAMAPSTPIPAATHAISRPSNTDCASGSSLHTPGGVTQKRTRLQRNADATTRQAPSLTESTAPSADASTSANNSDSQQSNKQLTQSAAASAQSGDAQQTTEAAQHSTALTNKQRRAQLTTAAMNEKFQEWFQSLNLQCWIAEQNRCPDTRPIVDFIAHGILPDALTAARRISCDSVNYYVDHLGLLRHLPRNQETDEPGQLVIPTSCRQTMLTLFHDDSGHVRLIKTYLAMKRHVYWHNMYRDVSQYVNKCIHCAKTTQLKPALSKLQHRPVRDLFDDVFVDNVFLSESVHKTNGRTYQHALVITERLSAYSLLIPVVDLTAQINLDAFIEHWYQIFGPCRRLHADNSSTFANQIWRKFAQEAGIDLHFPAAQRHASQGSIEEAISRYVRHIRRLENPKDWVNHVSDLNLSLNSEISTVSHFSAYEIIFGQDSPYVRTKYNLKLPLTEENRRDLIARWDFIEHSQTLTRERLTKRFSTMDKYYRAKRSVQFNVGQIVLIFDEITPTHAIRKLHRFYREGEVLEVLSRDKYRIKMRDTGRTSIVHVDRIKVHPGYPEVEIKPVSFVPDTPKSILIKNRSQRQQKRVRFAETNENEEKLPNNWYKIDRILDHRRDKNGLLFFVRWSNTPEGDPNQTSWIPASDVTKFAKDKYFKNLKKSTNSRLQGR